MAFTHTFKPHHSSNKLCFIQFVPSRFSLTDPLPVSCLPLFYFLSLIAVKKLFSLFEAETADVLLLLLTLVSLLKTCVLLFNVGNDLPS